MENVVIAFNTSLFKDPSEFVNDPEGYARFVIGHIPTMCAQELDHTARQAFKIESVGFLIRTHCVARLVKLATAQAGGRGKRDDEGHGIKAVLCKLAGDWKLALRTLQTDLAIYREFFAEPLETDVVDDSSFYSLGREYFHVALSAVEPRTAIEMAITKRQEGPYSVRQFDKDVARMGKKKTAKGRGAGKGVKILLDPDSVEMLDTLQESTRSEFPEACSSREQFVRFLIRKLSNEKNDHAINALV